MLLQSILDKVKLVDGKVDGVKEVVKETKKGLTEGMDKLGLQLAELSDDAPTIEEFDKLEKRVSVLENQSAKN
ncbi:hypothetical protein A2865_04025 [Candidatus Woesebacteria bacterium RIFCSPHIGHO2_01_FULL_39_17]|uniref:Uncharacterized protein n=3 Tax=Candidatus Woeseibacteriota TaxID=1752722 RepID=A0A0G0NBZ8_9BACT|nr:MAG: hypothetical protein US72_C0012G0007 [Microgenomates group bacterium GW2011_GWC1_38_12]KKQ93492.1 MAG: hypothetical protein UT19_C0011G0037 [Candidatus Woesebacteria bacterium GW2011_GWB1_39_10b]KKR13654.1 MAG: hypothetical protein UT40_C0012G0020 [Candidatus Woesebacteria bacterium GW2011_GWA1_39_21b]OGM23275.1 MAG: hypothetical protein A2865_04025 [Candidatus Woesebacteria bacterium RIFCSPHIGHO2_01_FULL_39_17]OGM65703.1 MAG: hypothetical protein A3A52_05245 [Candidatus Woesebacteria b